MINVLFFLATVVVIFEGAKVFVMGALLSEKRLEILFAQFRDSWESNRVGIRMIYGGATAPFIARNDSFLSSWYISGNGQIPRWSKYHKEVSKIIDNHYSL